MNSKQLEAPMANAFTGQAGRLSPQRHPVESWNELTAPEDYDLSFDKIEYQIRPAKWPWLVYII
jgi:hypothetical protein